MKNQIQQFGYQSVLPHGEPVSLSIGILKDVLYVTRLKAFRSLVEQLRTELDEEITASTAN